MPVVVKSRGSATHLYRIAQEAANNTIKHGKAKQIHITLADTDGAIALTVTDDGSGFPVKCQVGSSRVENVPGLGLRIMSYRAGMIGATPDKTMPELIRQAVKWMEI